MQRATNLIASGSIRYIRAARRPLAKARKRKGFHKLSLRLSEWREMLWI